MVVPVGSPPDAAIVILPAAFVTVIPLPAVMVAATGASPVEPIRIWPLVRAGSSVIEPALDTRILFEFKVETVVGTVVQAVVPAPVDTSAVPATGAVAGNVSVYDVIPAGGANVIPWAGVAGLKSRID